MDVQAPAGSTRAGSALWTVSDNYTGMVGVLSLSGDNTK